MDIEQIIRLVNTVSSSELTGFTYEESGLTVRLEKKPGETVIYRNNQECGSQDSILKEQPGTDRSKQESAKTEKGNSPEEGTLITSPLVGVFYAAPAEDAEAYVQVGDTVRKGQVLAIVEAMKLMNEIESDFDGIIAEILVENGQAVEYGQPLFRLK